MVDKVFELSFEEKTGIQMWGEGKACVGDGTDTANALPHMTLAAFSSSLPPS